MRALFLANWKMNKLVADVQGFVQEFRKLYSAVEGGPDVGIAPSFIAVPYLREALGKTSGILVGAQNVHWLESGAHTGEISPKMLRDVGADFAIIGHSERRQFYGETNEAVSKRAKAAIDAGLIAVVCVGETREEFEAKKTATVVTDQLLKSLATLGPEHVEKLVIAYEPVWAIGTGLAATPEIASSVHNLIREVLQGPFAADAERIPILYGGSTTPENVAALLSQRNINGALVGGASLKPDVFWQLVSAGRLADECKQ